MKKRIIVTLLSLAISFSFATLTASATPGDMVAEMNGTQYESITEAINTLDTSAKTTIALLYDTTENITIPKKRDIVLDLQGHTLGNDGNATVIANNGTLEIKNGTVTSSADSGMINNNSGSKLTMSDGYLIATGSRQAVYNDGGTLIVSGSFYAESATGVRATLHNKNNGVMTITGGTVVAKDSYAIYNEKGTLTIGTKDGACDTTTPIIQGKKYGVVANSKYKFYDGIIKGGTYHVGTATTGNTPTTAKDTDETKIEELEEDTLKILDLEDIDGVTYKTFYCSIDTSKVKVTFDANGGEVSPSYKTVTIGDAVGVLPEPTKFDYHFDGWFTDPINGDKIEESTVVSGAITYYAHWTYVEPTYVAWIDGVGYRTLQAATEAAKSGDTIVLGEGEYSLYNTNSNVRKNKNLTFVGQGSDKTKWYIGAEVPALGESVSSYNSDYSLRDAGTITFKNMTMQTGSGDYLGFTHLNNTVFEDCVINGKIEYQGYESATYINNIFNCPNNDYCLWTYTSPNMTFEGNTFNTSGKTINVYSNATNIGSENIVINFKNNTINSTNSFRNKAVMNINDSNRVAKNNYFVINFLGENKVNGIGFNTLDKDYIKSNDDKTCSRFFEFNTKPGTNGNSGHTIVNIQGVTAWENGVAINPKAIIDYDTHPEYETTITDWQFDDTANYYTRSVKRECTYCGRTFNNQDKGFIVTYTDGVEDEELFEDQVSGIILEGESTPAYNGTPTREGYIFRGWDKTVSPTVTATVTYKAIWEKYVPAPNTSDNLREYMITFCLSLFSFIVATIACFSKIKTRSS